MRRKIRKVLSGLLIPVMAAAAMLSGIPAYGEVPEEEEKVELYRYITFYDSAGGDINDTVGYHVREVTGTVCGDFIEAPVNDSPDTIDLQETDGYPRVIVNYAMNQGRQTDITEKCFMIRIPAGYGFRRNTAGNF